MIVAGKGRNSGTQMRHSPCETARLTDSDLNGVDKFTRPVGLGVVDYGHLWATVPGQNTLLLPVAQLAGADLFHPGIGECSVPSASTPNRLPPSPGTAPVQTHQDAQHQNPNSA